MDLQKKLTQFIKHLEASSLPDERKQYWIDKFLSGSFSEADEKTFLNEFGNQIGNIDYATKVTEADVNKKEEELKRLKAELLPLVQAYADGLPAMLEKRTKDYKQALKGAEDEMMTELKGVRTSQNEQDIESLRKKLASGK